MLGGLPGSASHVMINILVVERSRVGFHVPGEKEEEYGEGEEAKSEFVPAVSGEGVMVVNEISRETVDILLERDFSICNIADGVENIVPNVVIDSAMLTVSVSEVDG